MLAASHRLLPRPVISPNVFRANRCGRVIVRLSTKAPIDRIVETASSLQSGELVASQGSRPGSEQPEVGIDATATGSPSDITKPQSQQRAPSTSEYSRATRISRHALFGAEEKEWLKRGGWRERIQRFAQLKHEAEVEKPIEPGCQRRLVDYDFLECDLGLWEALFEFRLRMDGFEGLVALWTRLRSMRYNNLPPILSSSLIVESIVNAGLHDQALLHDFCQFVSSSYRLDRSAPPNEFLVYSKVMLHVLQSEPGQARDYHSLLGHLPEKLQLQELTERLIKDSAKAKNTQPLKLFQDFCFSIPAFNGMYDHIMPKLCQSGLYEDALFWHKLFVNRRDLPSTALSVEPLVAHLSRPERRQERRHDIVDILGAVEGSIRPSDNAPVVSGELERMGFRKLVQEFERQSPVNLQSHVRFSDDFCARLLATTFFSIRTIVETLKVLQVHEVGPQSMRAILGRTADGDCCDVGRLGECLNLLAKTGISTGDHRFCRLVYKLVAESNGQMLYEVATCDLHADEFDNWELQENLLARYKMAGDKRQEDRTVAILLFDCNEAAYDTKYMNILLRSALNTKNDVLFTKLLEELRVRQIPVTKKSRSWIFSQLLPERVKPPGETQGIPPYESVIKYIETMKFIMRGGTFVFAREWDDTMRTLLNMGRLPVFDELLLFLLKWYTNDDFRASQTGGVHMEDASTQKAPSFWTRMLRPSRIYDIIVAGFYHNSLRTAGQKPIEGFTLDERASSLAQHPTFWGLRFLAKVKDLGYPVEQEEVYRTCLWRLATMFSKGLQARSQNRLIRENRQGTIQEYIAAMEKIWGDNLFQRTMSIEEYAAQVIYFADRNWYNQVRGMLKSSEKLKIKHIVAKRRKRGLRPREWRVVYTRRFLLSSLKELEASGMQLDRDRGLSKIFLPYRKPRGNRHKMEEATIEALSPQLLEAFEGEIIPR